MRTFDSLVSKVTCSNGWNAPGADRRCLDTWGAVPPERYVPIRVMADYFPLHDKRAPDFWNPAVSFSRLFSKLKRNVTRGCTSGYHICIVNCRVHFTILGIYKISQWDISLKKFYQCKTSKQTGITVLVFSKDHGSQMWVSIRIP